jgi:hypothetical protein
MAATHVQHVQKALDQMNLQLHHVISDITGVTGLTIIDAILAGKRDPQELAKLRSERIKATEEVIAKSLVGDYRAEHLFTLDQSLTAYRRYQKLIEHCDREIRRQLESFNTANDPPAFPDADISTSKPSALMSLREELKRAFGVDLTKIPGIQLGIAQTLFGEIGPDLSKFRSASAFASWMGLCPDNDISGGKVLFVGTRKVKCRAATALRMAAQCLHHSKTPLGDFYRRTRTKLGAPKAITAGAHKLARIVFHLVTTKQEFDESRFAVDQQASADDSKLSSAQPPKHSDSNLYRSRRCSQFLRRGMSREKTSPPSRTRRNLGLASSPTLTGWLIRCEYGHVCQGWFPIPAFPRIRECCSERPEPSRARRAARQCEPLTAPDRSERIEVEKADPKLQGRFLKRGQADGCALGVNHGSI